MGGGGGGWGKEGGIPSRYSRGGEGRRAGAIPLCRGGKGAGYCRPWNQGTGMGCGPKPFDRPNTYKGGGGSGLSLCKVYAPYTYLGGGS